MSAEEIYTFFAEHMWRPSMLVWVGWPAALACFAGAIITVFISNIYLFGTLLFVVSVGLAGYLTRETLDRRRRWASHVGASVAQIERDFRRPDSTLCLVQRAGLGLRDRLLLVKRTDLHFKGYFMSPWKARRLAGAFGIGYVESAKVLSGVLPLSRIKRFRFQRSIRQSYVILTVAGLGGGLALLPGLLVGAEHSRFELIGAIALLAIGAITLILAFLHRLSQMVICTAEYDLCVLADRPDPDTVIHFLRRAGYRELRTSGLPSPNRTKHDSTTGGGLSA